jgi:hypothetical protein
MSLRVARCYWWAAGGLLGVSQHARKPTAPSHRAIWRPWACTIDPLHTVLPVNRSGSLRRGRNLAFQWGLVGGEDPSASEESDKTIVSICIHSGSIIALHLVLLECHCDVPVHPDSAR